MKAVLSVLLAMAVVAPTVVKADSTQTSDQQAKAQFIYRKIDQIEAETLQLRELEKAFASATRTKDGSALVAIIGLAGSLPTAAVGFAVGAGTERECMASSSCRMVIAGIAIADAAMVIGGGIGVVVSDIQREHIRANIAKLIGERAETEDVLKRMAMQSAN